MPKRSFDTLIMAEEEAEAEAEAEGGGGGGSGGGGSNSRKPNSLFVSFSKRRKGLFGKAAELCRLFDGVQVAVLVLSPTGNPFAFGHSSIDNVFHRYYLRQPTIPSSTYPLMITTTATMSDKHRHQAQKVETLKARVKRAQNRDGSAPLRDLKAWIDKAAESCKAVEELEFLRENFLALLERVRSRLILRSFSSHGEEEKVVETKPTVVGPVDNYVLDLQSVGMAADTSHVFCDMGPPPPPLAVTGLQNDMSYVLETFGHSSEQGKVLVGETNTYGRAPVVELQENYYFDNPYLISSTGFDQCVGMEGNTAFFAGESSAANVRSLAAMGPSNDMSFRSMEEFGYSKCGRYCEMEGVSYEQVFNYDQVSMLQLDGFEEVFDRKI
ncbi:hypothetical protein TIFTF001_007035 [Ficus carica]|uniref:MADS-box domain-containing protein n=1 Tax=Ficus carica TaxID=3494 RepID=A0AA88A5K0_FICCA|nr:hypothetical protein TIFTF001_007035 [Ficus carica]